MKKANDDFFSNLSVAYCSIQNLWLGKPGQHKVAASSSHFCLHFPAAPSALFQIPDSATCAFLDRALLEEIIIIILFT